MSFLVALALCAVLTPLLARLTARVGLLDRPSGDGLKIHAEPKPLSGGIGIVLATVSAAAIAGGAFDPWAVGAIIMMLAVGVVDDAVGLPPLVRLATQFAAGMILAVGGLTFGPLGVLGPIGVILAMPALTNAVNITDGQDGLAAGLALFASLGIWALATSQGDGGSLGPAVAGALLGFLLWNRPPARVFLGDGGAYAVGCLLVVLSVGSSRSWASILGTLLCLGPFAMELVSTVIRRALGKGSLVSGDREHVYDLLARHLGGWTRSTVVMWGVGALGALLGLIVYRLPAPAGAATVAVAAGLAATAAMVLRRAPGVVVRRST